MVTRDDTKRIFHDVIVLNQYDWQPDKSSTVKFWIGKSSSTQTCCRVYTLYQCSTCFPKKVSDLRHCCITDLESFVFGGSLVAGPPAMILISLFSVCFCTRACFSVTFNCSLTLVPVSSNELTHFSLSLFLISLSEIYLLHYDGDLKCYSLTIQ